MTDRDTFKIDNLVTQNIPALFGTRTPQLYLLPDMEPLGPFDLWAMLGCFSLLDPKKPTKSVRVTLTDFLEILDFVRTISNALGHYPTFASGDYAMVKESLHRLFTVEAVFTGERKLKTGRPGRPPKEIVEIHARVLASYAYVYPPDVIPPDQLPESKRRNVNKAKTLKNEDGPAVFERVDLRPEAIELRMSEELLRGLTGTEPNIGATIAPGRIFKLRRQIGNRPTVVKVLLWVIRQTAGTPKIRLERLLKALGLDRDKRNRSRTEETVTNAFDFLKGLGVVEDWKIEPHKRTGEPMIVVTKAADWHYPSDQEGEDPDLDLD